MKAREVVEKIIDPDNFIEMISSPSEGGDYVRGFNDGQRELIERVKALLAK